MKNKLVVPKFKSSVEESRFWAQLNLSKYFEPSDFQSFSTPNLKPSSTPISLRLPNILLAKVKEKANLVGMPYQSLLKQYIQKGILTFK
jgi:predicted DNA binding CopG/RHH family protein